ncbi:hypothetical protein HK405_001014 [Cladochytrium tenue]|nr:hypothetical protein HK405_001014 [Cladochytrium tenue]
MHDDAEDALDALVAMKQICFSTSASGDLLYGRPGYLYSLIFVRRHAGALGRARVPEALVAAVHAAVLQDGRRGAQRTYTLPVGRDRVSTRMPTPPAAGPLVWSWHAERYVGAAHGIAGSLGALLAVPRLLDVGSDASARTDADAGSSSGGDGTGAAAATLADVDAALSALASRRTANGNVPVRVDETLATSRQLYADSELVQFCHGAPGAAACLARAHEALGGRPALLDASASAADVVWERGLLRKGVGLCHGVSGNAYTFLALYRATGDASYFDRACKFFALALDFDRLPSLLDAGGAQVVAGAPRDDAGDVSLFQGLAGLALLGFEIGYWGQSKDGVAQGWVQGGFPCFTDVCE